MGLFKKMKDILFDEEEYTEQIKITPEMRNEEIPFKEEKNAPLKEENHDFEEVKEESKSERELFKSGNFPLDFDELEFTNQNSLNEEPKTKQASRDYDSYEPYGYERKKRIEKRTDYGRYERVEITETTERKKFKPSPIISPVYGVLDKDYKKEDVIKKDSKVTLDEVRNKAFGDAKEEEVVEEPKTTFYEETETVTLLDPKEQEKRVKTIDELLEDNSEVVVDIDRDLDVTEEVPKLKDEPDDTVEIPKKEKKEAKEEKEDENSSTNDLFDLIDSMYDSNEDGE